MIGNYRHARHGGSSSANVVQDQSFPSAFTIGTDGKFIYFIFLKFALPQKIVKKNLKSSLCGGQINLELFST